MLRVFCVASNSKLYAWSSCRPSEAFKALKGMEVTIQWHICALSGSAREVASGSLRTTVYVLLEAVVLVGAEIDAKGPSCTVGRCLVAETGIMEPSDTGLWG